MGDVNLSDYQTVDPLAVAASKMFADTYKRLGKPTDPFSDAGQKLIDAMIAIWEECYPIDAKTWYAERKRYKHFEKTIHEQVTQHTGRSLASYPLPIYKMMKATFKGFEPAERNNCLKMVKRWPVFQFANKA